MPYSPVPHPSPPTRRSALRRRYRRGRRAALVPVLAILLLGATLPPAPVALGVGDRLFPYLGNPGYDVAAYDISLTYQANDRPLDAVTRIVARATTRLDRFNLDFTHGTVGGVEVDGRAAQVAPAGEDLVVTPAHEVPAGRSFTVTVHHTSDPRGEGEGGWVRTADGLVMANQADAGHRVFPGNDHPSDKALFTFRVIAPKELTVVANGRAAGRTTRGETTTWVYRTLHPMATELAQVAIGRSAVTEHTGPHGLNLRDVVPEADRKALEGWTARTPGQISWMEARVGPYPFENYGLLIADASTGFELETQTLSLFERDLFTRSGFPEWYLESVQVHELAHQWFGDCVSPRSWSDLWLNEGHATWYEALYAEARAGRRLEDRMRAAYARSDEWRAEGGPPAQPRAAEPGRRISIFRPVVYDGGALVLYALRSHIGAAAFDRLERTWVRRHHDGTATTADFVALASEVSGHDQSAFLRPWLYDDKTPPMPGHPDWTTGKPA
ncbi:zinc metalloprotease [Streptomyces mashuensis]|uniref:Aminopeptidase N n=1 Tax=Streptomyces mashuensis TaxID=33904 RepID=A0A919ASV6_9ACTN|nr:M1 family metallopeptidase [Streptomyces mashuensis]GHF23920.1 zinc metalloprotease [Streptomyces mashuensis]